MSAEEMQAFLNNAEKQASTVRIRNPIVITVTSAVELAIRHVTAELSRKRMTVAEAFEATELEAWHDSLVGNPFHFSLLEI